MADNMTKAERLELAKIARQNAKVAKADIEQRQRELIADVEAQLAAIYKSDQEQWRDITEVAQRMVAEANTELQKRCQEMGIREQFRPSLSLGFRARGENMIAERRGELRKVAQTRLEADARRAKVEVDRVTADICTQLAAGGFTTDEARAFLDTMPKVHDLLPALSVPELDTSKLTWAERHAIRAASWRDTA